MLLLAAVLLATAAQLTPPGSPVPPIAVFLQLPQEIVGHTPGTVTKAFGDPFATHFVMLQNPHVPQMKNVRVTLDFPGARVDVLVLLCCEKSVLERVRLDRTAGTAALGDRFPETAREVERRFGTPSIRRKGQLIYRVENEIGVDTVTFGLEKDVVTSVEWSYFLD